MLPEDIENLNYAELSDLEKQEFVARLTLNYNRVISQLLTLKQYALAGILSIGLSLENNNPNRLKDLSNYAKLLYEDTMMQIQINQKSMQAVEESRHNHPERQETQQRNPEDFVDDQTDKEQ